MKTNSEIKKDNLLKLRKYLNYQLSFSILYLLSFFTFFFMFAAAAAAAAFSVFMLRVLYQENKTGWIVFFFVLVILPLITLGLISLWIPAFRPVSLFSIGLFYLYFFLLRFEVNEWVKELNSKIISEEKRKRHETEKDIFLKKF